MVDMAAIYDIAALCHREATPEMDAHSLRRFPLLTIADAPIRLANDAECVGNSQSATRLNIGRSSLAYTLTKAVIKAAALEGGCHGAHFAFARILP